MTKKTKNYYENLADAILGIVGKEFQFSDGNGVEVDLLDCIDDVEGVVNNIAKLLKSENEKN